MSEIQQDTAHAAAPARSRTTRKPKKSQIPFAILLIALIAAFGVFLWTRSDGNYKLPAGWLLGIAFGYILQRSRFCFTAAMRDPSLTGSTSLTRAALLAFLLTTFGFTAIKYAAFVKDGTMPVGNVIGVPLMVGALMFGVGMVISGGCASGTFMRIGEGFTMQMLTLVFFIIGNLIGAGNMTTFWGKLNEGMPKVFLPDVFGWIGALIVQSLIILLLYIAAVKWQKKKLASEE